MEREQMALPENKHWVMVAEVDDAGPRRDPSKPHLYVAITVQDPERRLLALQGGAGPAWLRGKALRLRTDLMSNPNSDRAKATRKYELLVGRLAGQGFTVNRDLRVWTVYVIELDPAGSSNPGKGLVYVGETSKTAEARFIEHTTGVRNASGPLYSRIVFKHGVRLRMDLAPKRKYFDQASSKQAECRLQKRLSEQGYDARGGH